MNKIILGTFILFFTFSGFAQIEKHRKLSDKVVIGGNLGLMFGSVTQVDISPLVGYRITSKLLAAAGITYQYYKDSRLTNQSMETSIYGGRLFSKYLVVDNFFIHIEYEALSLENKYFNKTNPNSDQYRFWFHSFLIGGGLRQPIGERSAVNLTLLYNLNESANSPYSNPIIRIGFDF